MKKITFVLLVLSFGVFSSKAQAPVPNGGFENWATATWGDSLVGWTTSFKLLSDIVFSTKSTTTNEGAAALELTSLEQTVVITTIQIPGIATLGKIQPDFVAMSAKVIGGVPFTNQPSKLKGWYQYTPLGGDSAIIYTILTKWNAVSGTRDTIADGVFINTATQSSYTQFNIDYTYRTQSITPDTMNIIILSSGLSTTPNSKILVDNLSFEYPQNIATNEKLDCLIYPNPSNGIVNVSLANNQKTTATLHNSIGQIVFTKTLSNFSNTLDLTSLPKGIYLLDLRNNDQRIVRKITLK